MQFGPWRGFSPGPGADNQVHGWQFVLMESERLADYPANTVALDTSACSANCNGEAETWPTLVVPESSHAKESIAKPPATRIGRIKVRLTTQAPLRGKSKPCLGRAVAVQAGLRE